MKSRYKISCAVAAILSGCGGAAAAADSSTVPSGLETVVVTADRRDESVQNVPMTVQAFTGQSLADLNVTTLDDLLKYTPNVTYGNNGPGQGDIFMRGLSAGFAGNQSSATAGNFPNVAIYLDDQSMQFPARNVDIYMADMERVEVLEGPQGHAVRRRRRSRRRALHHQQAQARHIRGQGRSQLRLHRRRRPEHQPQRHAQRPDHHGQAGRARW